MDALAEVVDNEEESRFELAAGEGTAVAQYRVEGDAIVFTHTEVPPSLRGRGVGGRLVAGALERVRTKGMRAIPWCPFVSAYMDEHPETQDLIADR